MNSQGTIILKAGREESLRRFHPWVFSGAIKKIAEPVSEGEVVRVVSADGSFLGTGHYQPGSIAVRIFTFQDEPVDRTFWTNKIRKAWELRTATGFGKQGATGIFRLINAEGDGMPGLVADYYGGVVVLQTHSTGMYLIRNALAEIIREVLGDRVTAVYDKSEKTVPFKADLNPADGYLSGNAVVPHPASENGLVFNIDWETGQKTGFFIDQRESRRLLESMAAGRKVLNLFCYTGGFSVYAMRGGASLVHSVDSSARAIQLTDENIMVNFPGDNRHTSIVADAFGFLKENSDQYNMIVLDPPAFAKHLDALPQALKAYKRINAAAIRQMAKGGILFTFSCSQIVSREKFREAVFSAAAMCGRSVSILYQLTQPADHPVSIYHPEGEYLKGLVLSVE